MEQNVLGRTPEHFRQKRGSPLSSYYMAKWHVCDGEPSHARGRKYVL